MDRLSKFNRRKYKSVYVFAYFENICFTISALEPELRHNLVKQQEACLAHSTDLVRQCLDHQFTESCLGWFDPIHYHSRSFDITPLDILVYSNELPHERELLKAKIQKPINEPNEQHTTFKVHHEFIFSAGNLCRWEIVALVHLKILKIVIHVLFEVINRFIIYKCCIS